MEFSSTQIRRRGATDFLTSYEHNCILQDSIPLKLVHTSYQSNCLCLDVAKIRQSDWTPLLNSISTAKTIQKIRFSSSWLNTRPVPVIHQDTQAIQVQIAHCLKKLFAKTNDVNELSFEHILFKGSSMTALGESLLGQHCNLASLSLRDCGIGDLGYSRLQNFLRGNTLLRTLDISACDLSAVAMSMIVDTLKSQFMMGHGKNWEDNLRYGTTGGERSTPSYSSGIKVVKLNDNHRLGESIVALLSAISCDDVRCLEKVELRNCDIHSSREIDHALQDLIEQVPDKLSVFDVRQNPMLDNDTSRALVQLLMSKLIENHPEIEYENLRSSPREPPRPKLVTSKIIGKVQKQHNSTYNIKDLVNEIDNLPVPLPSGTTNFVPYQTAARSLNRKLNEVCPNSTETASDHSSDSDLELDDVEYRDLPNSNNGTPKKKEKTKINWESLYHEERSKRLEQEGKSKNLEDKFRLMSKRITEMESLVIVKGEQLRVLHEEQLGHVLVEECFLETIESTFSKFQGFLRKLDNLGISEINDLPDFRNLMNLTQPDSE